MRTKNKLGNHAGRNSRLCHITCHPWWQLSRLWPWGRWANQDKVNKRARCFSSHSLDAQTRSHFDGTSSLAQPFRFHVAGISQFHLACTTWLLDIWWSWNLFRAWGLPIYAFFGALGGRGHLSIPSGDGEIYESTFMDWAVLGNSGRHIGIFDCSSALFFIKFTGLKDFRKSTFGCLLETRRSRPLFVYDTKARTLSMLLGDHGVFWAGTPARCLRRPLEGGQMWCTRFSLGTEPDNTAHALGISLEKRLSLSEYIAALQIRLVHLLKQISERFACSYLPRDFGNRGNQAYFPHNHILSYFMFLWSTISISFVL